MKVPEVVPDIQPGGSGWMTRMQSSAQVGLKGLRFLNKTFGTKQGWQVVERRFHEMSKASGRLPKESFGKCTELQERDSADSEAGEEALPDADNSQLKETSQKRRKLTIEMTNKKSA